MNNQLKSASAVAMMGEIFGQTLKEKNDWKKRMLATTQGIDFPDDFDTLPEEERKRRLDEAIKIGLETKEEPVSTFKVYKVYRKSQRRKVLERGLTEEEARRVVSSYPDSNTSMVVYTRERR